MTSRAWLKSFLSMWWIIIMSTENEQQYCRLFRYLWLEFFPHYLFTGKEIFFLVFTAFYRLFVCEESVICNWWFFLCINIWNVFRCMLTLSTRKSLLFMHLYLYFYPILFIFRSDVLASSSSRPLFPLASIQEKAIFPF